MTPKPRHIDSLPWELGENLGHLRARAAQALGVDVAELVELRIRRLSLDARRGRVRRIVKADVWVAGEIHLGGDVIQRVLDEVQRIGRRTCYSPATASVSRRAREATAV